MAALDGVVEYSPWVARAAYRRRPFASVGELGSALADAMRDAPVERRVALVRAHPELAAGGDADRRVRLRAGRRGARPRGRRAARAQRRLPRALRLPVRGLRARAHAGVDPRLGLGAAAAHPRARSSTRRSARSPRSPGCGWRTGAMISTHVLDTVARAPGRRRRRLAGGAKAPSSPRADRRRRPRRLVRHPSPPGRYRLVLRHRRALGVLPARERGLHRGDEQLHVPLLLNPFGYSTYRGS